MWLITLLASAIASAGIVCPPSTRAIRDFESLRKEVFYNGPTDPRRTYEEWAIDERESVEQVYERNSFAGQLNCRGFSGSVNLTGKGDVITTVAHNFYFSNGKRLNLGGSKCVARFKAGPGLPVVEYEIDESTLVVGTTRPSQAADHLDWAVVKLKKPVSGIKPIAIPRDEKAVLGKGQNLLAVSSAQTDHLKGKDVLNAPNVIHRCVAKVPRGDKVNERTFRTNCALGSSGSGSAAVQENGAYPILMGLGIRSSDDKRSGAEFDEDVAASVYIPLEGAFLQAARSAIGP